MSMIRGLQAPSTSGLLLALAFLLLGPYAHAHAPDTSYLRAVVSKRALELRFTFDLATLHRVLRLDANGDGKVTRAEAEAAAPDLASFLEESVTFELNGEESELGELQPLGWPLDAGDSVEEKSYGQTLLHVPFVIHSSNLIEDFYVLYEVYPALGSHHRAIADIEQDGKHLEVLFTELEPDYVYDTFWRGVRTPVPARDRVSDFREGVTDVWKRWWLPCLMAILAASTAKSKLWWPLALLVGVSFFYWHLLTECPDPIPGARRWKAGVIVGMCIVAFITYPVRLMVFCFHLKRK